MAQSERHNYGDQSQGSAAGMEDAIAPLTVLAHVIGEELIVVVKMRWLTMVAHTGEISAIYRIGDFFTLKSKVVT